MSPLFYFLAAATVTGAVAAMSLRNPVHCALCLVVTFAGLAGIYLGLGAQFLGLAQVMVYIGAVAILIVFVLLVTRTEAGERGPREPAGLAWVGVGIGGAVAVVLAAAVWSSRGTLARREATPELPGVHDLGEALMGEFVVPLQVVGGLLTAALVGAAVLVLRERHPGGPGIPGGRP